MGNKVKRDLFNKAMGYLDKIEKAADDIAAAFGHPSMEQFYAGTSKDETHLDRLGKEITDLEGKLEKLTAFITGDQFKVLPMAEQVLLVRQHAAMTEYLEVLVYRAKR
jgi:hypothetical protein